VSDWNFGDLYDAVGNSVPPDEPALLHGERRILWGELVRRTNNLAAALLAHGLEPGDKVAFYMRNRPEYIEGLMACAKARLVHVNVNYRYQAEELRYILEDSDARAVLVAGEFSASLHALLPRLPKLEIVLQLDEDAPRVGIGASYASWAEAGDGKPLDLRRSPDDLLFIYTGGTTGMPKGVMWRSEDLWNALGRGTGVTPGLAPPETLEEACARIRQAPGPRTLPACPLMHGTGLLTAINAIGTGGKVITLPGARFDAEALWDAVEREGVESLSIVGDAFARPMLRALDSHPGRWNLQSLKGIVSSGVMWSREVKEGLLRHHPGMILVDSLGSSEGVGFGRSISTAGSSEGTARFQLGERVKAFREDGSELKPGSQETGFLALAGPIPLGYYKDEEKTRRTFRVIGGVRYSIPGDFCRVDADGTIRLLGRGSVCINTGGEKVYPEEIEEALKTHPAVQDALVVGVPDEKWGQAVTALVELCPEADASGAEESRLRQHVREQLAAYKVPKHVLQVASIGRAANGKADYAGMARWAREQLGIRA